MEDGLVVEVRALLLSLDIALMSCLFRLYETCEDPTLPLSYPANLVIARRTG